MLKSFNLHKLMSFEFILLGLFPGSWTILKLDFNLSCCVFFVFFLTEELSGERQDNVKWLSPSSEECSFGCRPWYMCLCSQQHCLIKNPLRFSAYLWELASIFKSLPVHPLLSCYIYFSHFDDLCLCDVHCRSVSVTMINITLHTFAEIQFLWLYYILVLTC